jgi:lipopolysaccharide/colanic/teichoic acid biosynthesis glycosyltransferase
MRIKRLWKGIDSFPRLNLGESRNLFHSVESFRRIVDREKTRCDRNAHQFSLVVFGEIDPDRYKRFLKVFTDVLFMRIRCTDDVGWFDKNRIGIVLPDTPAEGAGMFMLDMNQRLSVALQTPPGFTIYTYPSQKPPKGNNQNGYRIEHNKQGTLFPENSIGPRIAVRNSVSDFSFVDIHMNRDTAESCPPEKQTLPAQVCSVEEFGSLPSRPIPLWKRSMDMVGASIMLMVFFPFMLLIGLVIKLVSKGPVFFKQERIGYSGKPFTIWKFRTMRINADNSVHRRYIKGLIKNERGSESGKPMLKLDQQDTQIIPLGRLLRKTCIDELPQLINVLRGEMSLVGPRPCLPYEYEEYSLWQSRRFDAIPGMTGLWQVSGKNRTTFKEMMRLDVNYSRNASFWLDLKILLKTIIVLIGQVTDKNLKDLAS